MRKCCFGECLRLALVMLASVLHPTWRGVADEGKYTINYFQYHVDFGCVCMLIDWNSCYVVFFADSYNYFQFKLKGKGRSAGGRCPCCAAPQVLFVN